MSIGAVGTGIRTNTRDSGITLTRPSDGAPPPEDRLIRSTPGALDIRPTRLAPPPASHAHTARRTALFLAVALGGSILALGGLSMGHGAASAPPPMVTVQQTPSDTDQIKNVVQKQFGDAENIHVSHDWALGISNNGQDDVSVLLHRDQGKWSIVDSDGGAYDADSLSLHSIPQADISQLLQTYQ